MKFENTNNREEERLKEMGSGDLISDLLKKYKPRTPAEPLNSIKEQSREKYISPIEELKERLRLRRAAVEGLPRTETVYSGFELKNISDIWIRLCGFIRNFNSQHEGMVPGTREYIDSAKAEISKVINFLDSLPIWKYKFSTDSGGDPEDDSIYYMTESGISIRIRRGSLTEKRGEKNKINFKTVIQPFMEKIIFAVYGSDVFYELNPKIGLGVNDYITDEFRDRIETPGLRGEYTSGIGLYTKGKKIIEVDGPESLDKHTGDNVNRIFFAR